MCHGAFFCSRLQNKTPGFFSVSVALLAMVTQGEVLVVLGLVGGRVYVSRAAAHGPCAASPGMHYLRSVEHASAEPPG